MPSREGEGTMIRRLQNHFALTPAALITFAHRSPSVRIMPGEVLRRAADRSRPKPDNFSLSSGAFIVSFICLLSSATMSFGVPAGTSTPTQPSPSMPGNPAAAMVGASGIDDEAAC